jgi:hypothetical protein
MKKYTESYLDRKDFKKYADQKYRVYAKVGQSGASLMVELTWSKLFAAFSDGASQAGLESKVFDDTKLIFINQGW